MTHSLRYILAACVMALLFHAAGAYAAPVTVQGAYAKPSLDGVTTGVLFLTLSSAEEDTLLGATTDAADTAELHDHVMDDGFMRMRQVKSVPLPAGEAVAFKPGGLHIMLFDVKKPLKAGDTLSLTLTFAKAEPLTITVPVADQAPEAEAQHEHHH